MWRNIFIDSVETQRTVFDFITHGNYVFAGTDNGVYRGSMDGQNWDRKDIRAFPTRDISALAIDGSRIYAGLLFGGEHWIFSSDNDGETWEIRAHEFSWLYDLLVFENRLWSARLDGLWYFDLDAWTNVEESLPTVPLEFELSQNYPNPFNPTTRINYSIPQAGFVSFKVYDLLGQEVITLVNEAKSAGHYIVEFKAAQLPSGIYFYQIHTNGFTQTKRMILLK